MPYKSDKQRAFFHSAGAIKAGISPGTVRKFDNMSKGMKLPQLAPRKMEMPKLKIKSLDDLKKLAKSIK